MARAVRREFNFFKSLHKQTNIYFINSVGSDRINLYNPSAGSWQRRDSPANSGGRFRNLIDGEHGSGGRGYIWAAAAGLNAALAAVSAKFFSSQLIKYGMVIFFSVTMWGCYVNSLKAIPSLQASVTNFATNFLTSGLAGVLFFDEPLPSQRKGYTFSLHLRDYCRFTPTNPAMVFRALLVVIGVLILSKYCVVQKEKSN